MSSVNPTYPDPISWSNAEVAIRAACKASKSVVLGVVIPTVVIGASFGIIAITRASYAPVWKFALGFAAVVLTWVLVQRIVLSAALTRRRELDWSKLSESGMLPAGITYDDQKLPQARWKWEIFSKADAAANSSTKRQQRDVILLHGFGSSGRRAWGTLPIMLLDHRKVNRVHVLSYPAHPAGKIPFTGHRTDQLIRELRLVLLEIAAKYRGEPHTKFAIFAHSLGGMLAASVVGASRDANIKQEERRLFARICKLVLIMSPVEGVRMARLGFPWRFPYALRPGSPFVLESMNSMKRLVTGDAYSGHAVELWIGSQDWLVDVNKLGAHYPGIAKEVLGDHSTWSSRLPCR